MLANLRSRRIRKEILRSRLSPGIQCRLKFLSPSFDTTQRDVTIIFHGRLPYFLLLLFLFLFLITDLEIVAHRNKKFRKKTASHFILRALSKEKKCRAAGRKSSEATIITRSATFFCVCFISGVVLIALKNPSNFRPAFFFFFFTHARTTNELIPSVLRSGRSRVATGLF